MANVVLNFGKYSSHHINCSRAYAAGLTAGFRLQRRETPREHCHRLVDAEDWELGYDIGEREHNRVAALMLADHEREGAYAPFTRA